MPRVRSRNENQLVSDFNKGRIVAYRNCGLSYHSNATLVGRYPVTVCYPHGFNGSCSHVTSPESRIGVVCKTTHVYTNSSTTFAAAWTLSSETMAAATLDAASQTEAYPML
ncbi:hypothetical protein TNCV_4425901 [Trichonephila clavipes]|nr:hypothetical protein TNCV_4425901 [Trichonephila clavipes]